MSCIVRSGLESEGNTMFNLPETIFDGKKIFSKNPMDVHVETSGRKSAQTRYLGMSLTSYAVQFCVTIYPIIKYACRRWSTARTELLWVALCCKNSSVTVSRWKSYDEGCWSMPVSHMWMKLTRIRIILSKQHFTSDTVCFLPWSRLFAETRPLTIRISGTTIHT